MAPEPGDEQLLRRVTIRLVGLLGLCSFFNTLDRLNISFAALQMNADLGLRPAAFGAAVGAFFWPYMVLEAGSNLALRSVGARRWLAAIVGLWAIASMSTALVRDAASLATARVVLGIAEAGFLPAVLYLSAEWFPANRRGRFMGAFAVWSVAASVVGAPLAAALLRLDRLAGLAGWRWLFVAEGAPSLGLAVACWFFLADSPGSASWLGPQDRVRLTRLVAGADRQIEGLEANRGVPPLLADRRLWILMALFFAANFTVYGLSYWMPLVLRAEGFSVGEIGWLAAAPGLLGCVSMIAWTRRSDRRGERVGHLAAPMAIAGSATVATGLLVTSPGLAVLALCVAVAAAVTTVAMLWILPGLVFGEGRRALGVGLCAAAGAASGLISPWLVGVLRETTGDFRASLVVLGLPLLLASLIALRLRRALDA